MKVAVNTRLLLKNRLEGIGRFTFEICKRFCAQHPEDEFFFLFDRPYDHSFVFGPNVRPVVLHPQARSPILWRLWFDFAIPRFLRKNNIDVFFSPDSYLSLKTKTPTLLVSHDIAYKHYPGHIPKKALRYYQKYFPKYHKRADHIIAVSEFTKKDLIQTYGLESEKITVAHNACSDRFMPISFKEAQIIRDKLTGGRPYFIYVGAIHPRKNITRLIKAFDLFKKESGLNHSLLLVGRMAWNTYDIENTFNNAEFKSFIHFLPHVSEELERIVAASVAMLYVSLHEGFGLPILEAMHAEVPVITSNCTSMPEVVGEAGVLVDPKSELEIKNAMIKIATDSDLRDSLNSKARIQRIKFSWDRSSEIIYKELRKLSTL